MRLPLIAFFLAVGSAHAMLNRQVLEFRNTPNNGRQIA
jgi:hypothetical protein